MIPAWLQIEAKDVSVDCLNCERSISQRTAEMVEFTAGPMPLCQDCYADLWKRGVLPGQARIPNA